MKRLGTDDIRQLDWGDGEFSGFLWENNGRDLRLFLEHSSLPVHSLLCHWASDLRVDATWLDPEGGVKSTQSKRGGPLLTWAIAIDNTPQERLRVSVDLAGGGNISLECEQITATQDNG